MLATHSALAGLIKWPATPEGDGLGGSNPRNDDTGTRKGRDRPKSLRDLIIRAGRGVIKKGPLQASKQRGPDSQQCPQPPESGPFLL
jgi:hypothetical protein